MQAGASTGLQVAAQSQRAQELAQARAERESQDQERQAQEAERQRQFDESHLLNVQKVVQDAAQLQQQTEHQNAMESRLLGYDTGRLAVEKQKADLEAKQQSTAPTVVEASGTTPGYIVDSRGIPHMTSVASMPAQARVGLPVRDADGNIIATDVGGGRIIPLAKTKVGALTDVQKEDMRDLDREINAKQSDFDAKATVDTPEHLSKYIALMRLKLQRDQILRGASAPSAAPAPTVLPPTPAPTVAAPTPAPAPSSGRIRVRDKSGKQFTVPKEQRDQAIAEGYTPLE